MTSRELLDWYRNHLMLLMALEQDLARIGCIGGPNGVRAQQYNSEPVGTNNASAASIQAWEGLNERHQSYSRELDACRDEVLHIINALQDCRMVMILTLYYLQALTDQQIASKLLISREHVNRLRRDALKALQ